MFEFLPHRLAALRRVRCSPPWLDASNIARRSTGHPWRRATSMQIGRFLSADRTQYASTPEKAATSADVYHGPLASTYKNLKIFSLSSLALTFTFTPLMFIIESSLPLAPRVALAGILLMTGGASTAGIAWCGRPYVSLLRRLTPAESGGVPGLEMTTSTMLLRPLTTRVYDTNFLVKTKRPFATWELARTMVLPSNTTPTYLEETVAETLDKSGNVIGRWVVNWDKDSRGIGSCHGVGKIVRFVCMMSDIFHPHTVVHQAFQCPHRAPTILMLVTKYTSTDERIRFSTK
jgi:hypothetical protein